MIAKYFHLSFLAHSTFILLKIELVRVSVRQYELEMFLFFFKKKILHFILNYQSEKNNYKSKCFITFLGRKSTLYYFVNYILSFI